MEIFKIVAVAASGTVLAVTLKKESPQLAMAVSVITGIVIFLQLFGYFANIISQLYNMTALSGIKSEYVSIILKVTGIAYITQIGSEICKDAGESAIGTKIEIAGKVLIAAACLPLVTTLFGTVMYLL